MLNNRRVRTGLGKGLMAMGVAALVAAAIGAHGEAAWATSGGAIAAALLVTGAGVLWSVTAMGRVWTGYLGLLLFIPSVVALSLFALLRSLTKIPLPNIDEIGLVLGLFTLSGASLALTATERAIPLADQQERLQVEFAFQGGSWTIDPKRRAAKTPTRFGSVLLLLGVPFSAVAFGQLPIAQAPALVAITWVIRQGVLALHELAHALCGLALGHGVRRIVIGGGAKSVSFKLGSASVVLGWLPSHGLVEFDFGALPVWTGLPQTAWAGPASGLLPFAVGLIGLLFYADSVFEFSAFAALVFFALLSIGQLVPFRARRGGAALHSDGMWLFLPETVLKHVLVCSHLPRLRVGLPTLVSAKVLMPRFVESYERIRTQTEAAQHQSVLALLASDARSAGFSSPVDDSPMCELFLLGALLRLSLVVEDTSGLVATVDRYVASPVPTLFKTRALDMLACGLLFPPQPELLPLAEEWSRRALTLSPDDLTLYGTLGAALIERGNREEGKRHLQHLLKHTRNRADRRLARKYLARA